MKNKLLAYAFFFAILVVAFLAGLVFSPLLGSKDSGQPIYQCEFTEAQLKALRDQFPTCPPCPDCQASASCNREIMNFEGSHLTADYSFNQASRSVTIQGVDLVGSIYGASMQPAWYANNALFFRAVNGNKSLVHAGDIVWFQKNGSLTEGAIHKVVGLYPDYAWIEPLNGDGKDLVPYADIKYLVLGGLYK